ncbi:acyltransferase domain-containing protein, partial [Streptomyces sp. NRRL F-5123]|uniref:acyltransferase domain-containing protein n=1 Tax=Streptomyces sp. NRRL F-5123 TaxID=1463856 RepID=UPI0005BAF3B2
AHIAGVLTLEDAARLVTARATLMGELPPGGAMATVNAGEEEITAFLADHHGLSVAAFNTPVNTVLSGPAEQITAAVEWWKGRGRKARVLQVSHAFHSPLMDPVLTPFTQA